MTKNKGNIVGNHMPGGEGRGEDERENNFVLCFSALCRGAATPFCRAFSLLLVAASVFSARPAGAAFALYTPDYNHNTILKMNTNGVATVFATNGVNGLLDQPGGLVMDNLGDLYVANLAAAHPGNRTIEMYNAQGIGSLFAGSGSINFYGLAMDVSNNVYVATYLQGNILNPNPRLSARRQKSSGTPRDAVINSSRACSKSTP